MWTSKDFPGEPGRRTVLIALPQAAGKPVAQARFGYTAPTLELSPVRKEGMGGRRHGPFGKMFWPSLLAAATLVLGSLAAWFGTEAAGVTGAPSAQNLALADTAETSQVTARVKKHAPAQKLVVATTVTSAGVERLTPDTARVLVFATESDRKADGTPATAGAMLAVNVIRVGSTWKISGIDTLG